MLKYKIMFQIFFVPKYFWVLEAVIFGTLLPGHPVVNSEKTFGYVKVHFMRDENSLFSVHIFNIGL